MFDEPAASRLAHIVETGAPGSVNPRDYRILAAPVPVWLDLAVVHPLPPHHRRRHAPDGLVVRGVVPGRISMWVRSADGDWLAWAIYEVGARGGRGVSTISHWVPAHALRRAP